MGRSKTPYLNAAISLESHPSSSHLVVAIIGPHHIGVCLDFHWDS